MATITKEAEVPAAPEDVWAKLTDLATHGEWLATHVDFPNGTPDDVTEGATFKEKVTIMGMPGEVDWTVTKVEPNAELEMTGKGPMGTTMRAGYKLEASGDGTSLTCESEFGGAALAAMAKPLETASDQALEKSLQQFKELMS